MDFNDFWYKLFKKYHKNKFVFWVLGISDDKTFEMTMLGKRPDLMAKLVNHVIPKDDKLSLIYARDVIKTPWKPGEKIIYSNPTGWVAKQYNIFIVEWVHEYRKVQEAKDYIEDLRKKGILKDETSNDNNKGRS